MEGWKLISGTIVDHAGLGETPMGRAAAEQTAQGERGGAGARGYVSWRKLQRRWVRHMLGGGGARGGPRTMGPMAGVMAAVKAVNRLRRLRSGLNEEHSFSRLGEG